MIGLEMFCGRQSGASIAPPEVHLGRDTGRADFRGLLFGVHVGGASGTGPRL